MEPKLKQDKEIQKIEKITGFLLPNKFKIIGLVLFIISIISMVSVSIYLEKMKYNDFLVRIAETGLVLGLLLISISKEKIEDELVLKLRLQSYNYAVIATVLVYLILPFFNYAIVFSFSSAPKMEGNKDIPLLAMLLTLQILTLRSLKRAYNEK